MPKNRFLWMLLAIQGGFINIGGLLTIHLFVSHVTGFSAHFSRAFIANDLLQAFYFLLVPFSFLLGAFFSSLFTEVKKSKNQNPRYLIIMLVISFIFLAVALGGSLGFFGVFGEAFINFRDFVLLVMLAFSCGSQNALFTNFSNSIIRTTHLTGITTDLGIGFAKYFVSKDRQEGKLNRVRIEIIIFFILGSILGSLVFPKLKFVSFIFPSINSLFIGLRLYLDRV